MKTAFYKIFGMIAFLTLFACSSDDGGASSANFYVEYKVDNQTYRLTDSYEIGLGRYQYSTGYTIYTLVGTNLNSQSVVNQVAIMFTDLSEGTFSGNANSGSVSMIYTDGPTEKTYSNYCPLSGGSFTVTSINGDIVEGTFNMNLIEDVDESEDLCNGGQKTITNGKFRLRVADTE